MPTAYSDIFAALSADFAKDEVKWRPQSGRDVPYVTARVVMNRLDNVLGPDNWWDDYVPSTHSVMCKLTIRLPDGSTVTKHDAGGAAEMKDEGDGEKSAYSDAFKRAAVKFGVGRILYGDGVPNYRTEPTPEPQPEQAPVHGRAQTKGSYVGVDPEDEAFDHVSFWQYLCDRIEHFNAWAGSEVVTHHDVIPFLMTKTHEKKLHKVNIKSKETTKTDPAGLIQVLTDVYAKSGREALYIRRLIRLYLVKRARELEEKNAKES